MARMMEGKVAVVTGAGGGVAREIAIMMADAGAKVIVADIGASLSGEGGSASPAEQTKALIEQKGVRPKSVPSQSRPGDRRERSCRPRSTTMEGSTRWSTMPIFCATASSIK
jgi:NAD(P)-dependent dehydrogenase (short-subunit alcohol dehydrogenase family)